MEKLKSILPDTLKQRIAKTTPHDDDDDADDDLSSTCSSLLQFFQHSPLFHQFIGDLTDPETALCRKDKKAALELKLKGNQCFSNGDYTGAMRLYSQALCAAPAHVDDIDKDLLATLYVNRAASSHKMGLLAECLRDCRRALVNCPSYAKAWFRRGKANASLGNYEDAIRDFKISITMETSSSGKRQIEGELQAILQQFNGTSGSPENLNENTADFLDEPDQIQLQRVSIPNKGKGMISGTDIPQSSLIHKEEPYAAIILKHCRGTHCHFCFNELPPDTVPCTSCTKPLYCSEKCLEQAGGQIFCNIQRNDIMHGRLSDDLEEYLLNLTSISSSSSYSEHYAEHRHECQGVNWPTVLPSEVVLAGRVLVKSLERKKHCGDASHLSEILDLSQNYAHLSSESRMELLIYSIILMYCLQRSYCSELPLDGDTASQIVIILSQVRVNSMAIVRMKVSNGNAPLVQHSKFSSVGQALTNSVEQVKVGQAIYLAGSSFNHSCRPNIHAYFLSRTLYIRATQFLPSGSQLELSYGPQVGQQDCRARQQFLEDRYSFICECTGCSQLNLSDLVISAYRCVQPNCFGVILKNFVAKYEKQKLNRFLGAGSNTNSSIQPENLVTTLKGNELNNDGMLGVAHHAFEQIGYVHQSEPSYCSNCGSYLDLEASSSKISKAKTYFKRLQDAIASDKISPGMLLDGLKYIDLLRKTLHPLNKRIAEAEDNLAQAHCLVGELRAAVHHCQSSVKILEKLYDPDHIVIGNELIKLTSLQASMDDTSAVDSINRIAAIFSRHYGSHMDVLFPYLQSVKRDVCKILG